MTMIKQRYEDIVLHPENSTVTLTINRVTDEKGTIFRVSEIDTFMCEHKPNDICNTIDTIITDLQNIRSYIANNNLFNDGYIKK